MLAAQLEAYQPLYHTFAVPVSAARKPLLVRLASPVVARQPVAQRKDGKLVRQVSPVVALLAPALGTPREPSKKFCLGGCSGLSALREAPVGEPSVVGIDMFALLPDPFNLNFARSIPAQYSPF